MELFKLFGTILIDNEKANQSISKTDKALSQFFNMLITLSFISTTFIVLL